MHFRTQIIGTMKEHSAASRIEPRWPAAVMMLIALLMLAALPARIRLFPSWIAYLAGITVVVPMLAVGLTAGSERWLRVERVCTLLFFVAVVAGNLANLGTLIGAMVHRSAELSGIELLASSIAIWITNVLAFSLLYWQIDRGGPEARLNHTGTKPCWLFPQDGVPQSVQPDWRPTYFDYLFLGFSTATAFSATDALPLKARAMVLMMLESSISLVTLVIVAARSINMLGN